MRSTRSSRPPRSRPAPGSSRSRISGSDISDRAMRARLRSPSERVPKVRPASASIPHSASSRSARSRSFPSYSSRQRPSNRIGSRHHDVADGLTGRDVLHHGAARPADPRLELGHVNRADHFARSSTSPRVGNIRPEITSMSVVLPAPSGPSTTQRSPSSIVRLTPSSSSDSPRRTVTPRRTATLGTRQP